MRLSLLFLAGLVCVVACGETISEPNAAEPTGDAGASADSSARAATDGGGLDAKKTTTVSSDGAIETVDASNDPSCNAQTKEDDPCTEPGAFCNATPCTDPCQFCNVLRCEGGKWGRMEAFPMPSSYCAPQACGTLTCASGKFCVRSVAGVQAVDGGSNETFSCESLPSGCTGCSCAQPAAGCAPTTDQCTPDPTTGKPYVSCYGI